MMHWRACASRSSVVARENEDETRTSRGFNPAFFPTALSSRKTASWTARDSQSDLRSSSNPGASFCSRASAFVLSS